MYKIQFFSNLFQPLSVKAAGQIEDGFASVTMWCRMPDGLSRGRVVKTKRSIGLASAMCETGLNLGSGLSPVVYIKFFEDIPQMIFNRINTDSQNGGNL